MNSPLEKVAEPVSIFSLKCVALQMTGRAAVPLFSKAKRSYGVKTLACICYCGGYIYEVNKYRNILCLSYLKMGY